ncbi:MAG: hypothetical protein AB7F65_01425 [Dehalococcoidia bacterium]
MSIIDRLRALFGQPKQDETPTDEQLANREEAERALDAMTGRR